jgi:hypothetical protein
VSRSPKLPDAEAVAHRWRESGVCDHCFDAVAENSVLWNYAFLAGGCKVSLPVRIDVCAAAIRSGRQEPTVMYEKLLK